MPVVLATLLFILTGYMLLGLLLTIANVGKPRKPLTPADAARTMTVGLVIVGSTLLAALTIAGGI